ncbi:MAG TPA: hypothetical protein P5509_09400 [Bacteroidales bacterium]|nr:hypothetical protein [Bacteroidales bacterium]
MNKRIPTFESFLLEIKGNINMKDIDKVIKNLESNNLDRDDIILLKQMANWFKTNFKTLTNFS